MVCDEHHAVHDPLVRCIFRRKARQIVGHAGVTNQDVPDVEHELLVAFLQHLPEFDPERGHLHAFTNVIADHAVADYLRRRRARKRDDYRTISLSTPVVGTDGSTIELAECISQRELDARRGASPNDQDAACLALDIATVLDTLPANLRHLAERRQAGDSVTQIAKDLGLPRTTLGERILKLRLAFERAGLRAYL